MAHGLLPQELARYIADHSLEAVLFKVTAEPTESWIFGDARIPERHTWPIGNSVPMSHIARVALKDLPQVVPSQPQCGHLSFFLDESGFSNGGCVIYDDGSEALRDLVRPGAERTYNENDREYLQATEVVWTTMNLPHELGLPYEAGIELADRWCEAVGDTVSNFDPDHNLRGQLFGRSLNWQSDTTPEPRFMNSGPVDCCYIHLASFWTEFFNHLYDMRLSDLAERDFSNVTTSVHA